MIGAVLLGAGKSRRFGEQKLLKPLRGEPILRSTAQVLPSAGLAPVVVVTTLSQALDGLAVRVVPPGGEEMSASLRAGIAALPSDLEGAFVALGDQPGIGADVLAALQEAFRRSGKPIAAPFYRGVRGNPVLFSSSLFPELRALSGDRGARDFLSARPDEIFRVDFDREMPRDVDTPADYQALLRD